MRNTVSIFAIFLTISLLQLFNGGAANPFISSSRYVTAPPGTRLSLFCEGTNCNGRQRFEGPLRANSNPHSYGGQAGYRGPVPHVPHSTISNNNNCNPYTTRGCLSIRA